MGPAPSTPRPPTINNPSAPFKVKSENDNKLLEINFDSNADGSGLTLWTVAFIAGGTLCLAYIVQKIRKCRAKAKIRQEEKVIHKKRLEALAISPLMHALQQHHAGGHRRRNNSIQFDNDRFEEIEVVVQPAAPLALPQIQAPPPAAPAPPPAPPAAPAAPVAPAAPAPRRGRNGAAN